MSYLFIVHYKIEGFLDIDHNNSMIDLAQHCNYNLSYTTIFCFLKISLSEVNIIFYFDENETIKKLRK